MSDAGVILRDVYGPNAAKKIARRFNVAVITAKVWLAGRFPESRTQELAAIVREELDIIDARNKEIRKQLGLAGSERGDDAQSIEMGGGTVGLAAQGASSETHRKIGAADAVGEVVERLGSRVGRR